MNPRELDTSEVEMLIVALRYWRVQRGSGLRRRNDAILPLEKIDLLLAKLGSSTSSPPPPPEQRARELLGD